VKRKYKGFLAVQATSSIIFQTGEGFFLFMFFFETGAKGFKGLTTFNSLKLLVMVVKGIQQ